MKPNYSVREVKGLVEHYQALRERKDTSHRGLHTLIILADLDRAISLLPPKEYQAILLYGQLRHTVRDAEQVLEVARSTVQDRFNSGISWIVKYLNEGSE